MTDRATRPTEDELRQLAARGAAELEGASAADLLRWTDENFGGVNGPRGWATCNYVVASNMQDAVLVDLAAKVRPGVPVLFLDTGYHFVETIGTRDAVESVYDIRVLNVAPEHTVAEAHVALDIVLGGRRSNVVEDRCAVCDRLRLRPRLERVAERVHVRVRANARVFEEIPGAAEILASLQDHVALVGAAVLQMPGRADSRDARSDDDDVDKFSHGVKLSTLCRGSQQRVEKTRHAVKFR